MTKSQKLLDAKSSNFPYSQFTPEGKGLLKLPMEDRVYVTNIKLLEFANKLNTILDEEKKINSKEISIKPHRDFLSMDEVDRLLRGVTGESENLEEKTGSLNSSNTKKSREDILLCDWQAFDLIMEKFAILFRKSTHEIFNRNIDVFVYPVRTQSYREFVRNLIVPTCLIPFNEKSKNMDGMLIFDPNLIFLYTDNLFGGDGRFHTRVEGRDFSKIEQCLIDDLTNFTLNTLRDSFKNIGLSLEYETQKFEKNPRFIDKISDDEIVFSISFSIEIGGAASEFHFCFPYKSISAISYMLSKKLVEEKIDTTPKLPPVKKYSLDQLSEAVNIFEFEKLHYILKHEHPQVASFILSFLKPEIIANHISQMTQRFRNDVMLRHICIEDVSNRASGYLIEGLKNWQENVENISTQSISGINSAVEILKKLSQEKLNDILDSIGEYDPDLQFKIKNLMDEKK